MSCRFKGGSVASDAVTSSIPQAAFSKLDANFTNLVGGKSKKPKSKKKAPPKSRSGGMCMVCGGAKQVDMKHFNDLDNSGLKHVHNKKGGADISSSSPLFDIRYDYSQSMAQPAHGLPINRALNYEATNLMATESTSALGGFNKITQYGNMTDLSNGNFVYGGGRKKTNKSSTKRVKKTSTEKSKPKKASKTSRK